MRESAAAPLVWVPVSLQEAAARIRDCEIRGAPRPTPLADPGEPPSTFPLADFQLDALARAGEILDRRGGVIVADAVGLGKTYVALGLAEAALRECRRVTVVGPPALAGMWLPLLTRLAPGLEIGSRHQEHRKADRIRWLSTGLLSRGRHTPATLERDSLLIVDEAHQYRNPRTRRYRELARLCRGARVVLLTATPVNNSLSDLYFLIRLFAGDGAFRDLGIADLGALLRQPLASAHVDRADSAPTEIVTSMVRARVGASDRRVAAPASAAATADLKRLAAQVIVRRTRADLQVPEHVDAASAGLGAPPMRFPRRSSTLLVRYDLSTLHAEVAASVTDELSRLRFTPYCIDLRSGRPGRAPARELMRLSLLKRLESSRAAFLSSLRRVRRVLVEFLDGLAAGRLQTAADRAWGRLYGGDGGGTGRPDVQQLTLMELVLPEAPNSVDLNVLARDAEADLCIVDGLLKLMSRGAAAGDPKLERLSSLIADELRGEKVVIFTEFRETARVIWSRLSPRGHVGLVDGGGARMGAGRAGRRTVVESFAPRANGRPQASERERIDVLIATDVLSEGLNLQDARCVIAYDLPWNPVRLIQRIGRVDRLGSPHEEVQPIVFLPDRGLEPMLRLVQRIQRKLAAIRQTVGDEIDPLDAGERPEETAFLDRLAAGDTEVLDEAVRSGGRSSASRREVQPVEPLPSGTAAFAVARRTAETRRFAALVAVGDDASGAPVFVHRSGRTEIDRDRAGNLLERIAERAATISLSDAYAGGGAQLVPADRVADDRRRRRLAELALLAERAFQAERARSAFSSGSGAGSTESRLARMLLSRLSSCPGGAGAGLMQRADRIVEHLGRGVTAGEAAALEPLLIDSTASAEALIRRMEAQTPSAAAEGGSDAPDPALHARSRLRPVAALLFESDPLQDPPLNASRRGAPTPHASAANPTGTGG